MTKDEIYQIATNVLISLGTIEHFNEVRVRAVYEDKKSKSEA